MDRGGDETERRGQHERVGGKVKMSPERGGGERRETGQTESTGGEMKVIHHQYMKRDTIVEERRGEYIKEKRACSGIRIEEERGIEEEGGILKEVGKERAVQIKRKTQRGGVLQHLGVIVLPLLGHSAVTSSNLQKMTAEVRRYGTLHSSISRCLPPCESKMHFRLSNARFIMQNTAEGVTLSFPRSARELSSPASAVHKICEAQL